MGLAKNHTIFRTHVVGNKDVVSMFGWLLVAFRTAAVKEAGAPFPGGPGGHWPP